jgi:hypothetical protein
VRLVAPAIVARVEAYDAVGEAYVLVDEAGGRCTARLHGRGCLRYEVVTPAPAFAVGELGACGVCHQAETPVRRTRCCGQPMCDACVAGTERARRAHDQSVALVPPPSGRACPFCRAEGEAPPQGAPPQRPPGEGSEAPPQGAPPQGTPPQGTPPRDALAASRAACNAALLAAEPRRRWPDGGVRRLSVGATHAEALARFVRERRGANGKLAVGDRTYSGFYDYRTTQAVQGGGRHDAAAQERHTLLLDDVEHARDHLPGMDALAHAAAACLPEAGMRLLHGHVLDQASPHSRFADHQDTDENRKRGARKPDRHVVYTVVLKLTRGGDTAMRVLGCEPVTYEAEAGTGVAFKSALWHRTERASEGTMKLALFFGQWLA